MRFWLLLALGLSVGVAQADVYEGIESHFESASQPELKDLKGHVAGRCVESVKPDSLLPAVLLVKNVADETAFPPTKHSFSYYSEKGKPEAFDSLSVAAIEKHPGIASWMKQEQWQKIEVKDGSLVNYFTMAGGVKFMRSLRLHEETDASYLLLQVARLQGGEAVPMRYCYFHKALTEEGDDSPVPTELPGADYVIGETQGLSEVQMSLINQEPGKVFRKLRIVNYGRRVRLRNFQLFLSDGGVSTPTFIDLPDFGTAMIDVHPYPTFQLRQVSFYIEGRTPNIRVWGVSRPDARVTDTLVIR